MLAADAAVAVVTDEEGQDVLAAGALLELFNQVGACAGFRVSGLGLRVQGLGFRV